jgi:hypothetical protein
VTLAIAGKFTLGVSCPFLGSASVVASMDESYKCCDGDGAVNEQTQPVRKRPKVHRVTLARCGGGWA